MKTMKIFLSIAGFALTTICFGQLLSQNNSEILFYTAHYNTSIDRFEHQVHAFPGRTTSGDQFDAPLLSRTYYAPIESDILLEPWMTTPFESSFYEMDLQIESWMISPFENSYYESDLVIESWMTAPFASEEEIEIESWMTQPWI